ncbi:hypothetical protein G6F57_018721 [Rhizopus arrhizus]|nr:hypothetical protein G6F65_019125 [Rhizopus arrhizus]KAG1388604.1 hypothetical protein G6F60_013659 [Rhizopus arrhizus]KAG1392420.1 hypothetical protein G6F59_014606 [Rhizopus arrhizus]KAG1441364.1 hypothetical protein G6F57_018721 [Rhizopus arrhizus]
MRQDLMNGRGPKTIRVPKAYRKVMDLTHNECDPALAESETKASDMTVTHQVSTASTKTRESTGAASELELSTFISFVSQRKMLKLRIRQVDRIQRIETVNQRNLGCGQKRDHLFFVKNMNQETNDLWARKADVQDTGKIETKKT